MASFSALKKRSSSRANIEKLKSMVEESGGTKKSYGDDRFWKPDVDKSGNGYSVIRFLPTQDEEHPPFVQTYNHGFQDKGGWFIEECPTTLGKGNPCPVCESNGEYWNSGIEANKDIARKRKRRMSYISNIYIVSDPKHPENEGKVFLYRYGQKIFAKVKDMMFPEFEDETPMDPFDFWEGANFKLKIRQVEGYRNYDKSEFDATSELEEEVAKGIWEEGKLHDLQEFVSTEKFKSYDDLKAHFNRVVGAAPVQVRTAEQTFEKESDSETYVSGAEQLDEVKKPTASASSDDDTMSYFAKLAAD
jgi:hypothetical protein